MTATVLPARGVRSNKGTTRNGRTSYLSAKRSCACRRWGKDEVVMEVEGGRETESYAAPTFGRASAGDTIGPVSMHVRKLKRC